MNNSPDYAGNHSTDCVMAPKVFATVDLSSACNNRPIQNLIDVKNTIVNIFHNSTEMLGFMV